jgi:pimeloyl-ACP methyl ester carboxylesterase
MGLRGSLKGVVVQQRLIRSVVDGESITSKCWEGGSGDDIVLLQGGMADAEAHWACIWDALSSKHHVIAPDLPGFGQTEPLGRPNWRSLSEWLNTAVRDLTHRKISLVGNSFGGTLARAFAGYYPALTANVVLIDGGSYLRANFMQRLVLGSPVGEKMFQRQEKRGIDEKSFRDMMTDYDHLTKEERQNWSSRSGYIYRVARGCVLGPIPADAPSVPKALIWGVLDRHTPLERAELLKKELGRVNYPSR